jgi:hypothetical protein
MKIKFLVALFVSLTFIVQCDKDECPVCELPEEGLLAYYPFNHNANDESNNMHNGIIYGAEFKNDRSNNINQSLFFDGIGNFLKLDAMESFNSALESFSVSFWIKADTAETVYYETLMKTINNDATGTMFSIEIHRGPSASLDIGVIRLDLRDNNNKYFTIYVHRPNVFDNDWHNITFIISSAKNNQGDVFIDGELESKNDYFVRYGSESPADFKKFDNNLTIGAGNNRGTVETFFRGYLDEIAFYNRPLTTKEILQLFNR